MVVRSPQKTQDQNMTQESNEAAKVGTKRQRPDSDTKPSTNPDERTESNNPAEGTKRQKTEPEESIVQVRETQEPASQGWT